MIMIKVVSLFFICFIGALLLNDRIMSGLGIWVMKKWKLFLLDTAIATAGTYLLMSL